jgi:hypothetical protein
MTREAQPKEEYVTSKIQCGQLDFMPILLSDGTGTTTYPSSQSGYFNMLY